MTETTCPRCGSARSKAASFCGVCGQDLRPGARVVPEQPLHEPTPAKDAEGAKGKGGRRLLRRKSKADDTQAGATTGSPGAGAAATTGAASIAGTSSAADAPPTLPGPPAPVLRPTRGYRPTRPAPAAPTAAAASTTSSAPGIPATGPITLPGGQRPLPKEKPAPKPAPAVVPKEDTSLSFSERYRGTVYSNPDIERYLPPPVGAKGRRRWGRILLVLLLLLALVAAAVGGSWIAFFSPNAIIGPGTSSPSAGAVASSTPRPTPTPSPTIHGLLADEVEVAACLLLAEDAQQQVELATLRTDALAGGSPDLAARADALAATIAASRSSLPTLEAATPADALEPSQALAAAWVALYDIESDALAQLSAAPTDADALKAAVKRLDEAKAARTAVEEAHAALVALFPEATCVVVP